MLIKALAFLVIVLVNAGCSYLMPPQKIPMDRRNYVDAVSTSWKEQLLTNLVKLRYGDTLTFLELASITTSYSLDTNANAAFSRTWNNPFWHSLLVSGGVNLSDKPSITYNPIRGEALTKTMITPIDPSKILKSLQTGWEVDYIFPCCVKSVNDLRNPSDDKFFDLAKIFDELTKKGVIRITLDETKGPTKYDITLHTKDITFKGKEKAGSGDEAAVKAIGKNKKVKKSYKKTDNNKEVEEEPSIALLVLDKERAKGTEENFKKLLWQNYDLTRKQGQFLYEKNCRECHGGSDNSMPSKGEAVNFNDPHFWVGELDQKIPHAVTSASGEMKKREIKLKPTEIRKVLTYIKHAFGKFEVYRIIDGNGSPPQKDPYCDKIVLQTRSILQVLIALSELTEVPPEHIKELRVRDIADAEKEPLVRDKLRIKFSKERPKDAFVAIQHRDFWFYIEDKIESKDVFSSTEGILSMSEPGTKEGTPVLTLPVQ